MTTFSLAVITVDRPYRETFIQRLVETRTVFDRRVRGLHIAYERPQMENVRVALRAAVADGADWVILFEDDIDIVDDFIGSTERWLSDHARDHVHFYPLGSAAKRSMRKAFDDRVTCWMYPLKHYFGATAVAMRTADACSFLDFAWNTDDYLDVNLQRWHVALFPASRYVITPVPCLIQHEGQASTLSGESHWSGRYPGWLGRSVQYRDGKMIYVIGDKSGLS